MPLAAVNQISIEKSPGYFTHPLVPERVHAYNNSIKLILLVRNPVIRTVSDYTQVHYTKMSKGKQHLPLQDMAFNKDGHLNFDYKPIRNSLYAFHLEKWLRFFPLSQIHIVDGDRFIENPLPYLQNLEQFLGVRPIISTKQLYFNATKGFYCFRTLADNLFSPEESLQIRCLGDTKGRPHVNISTDVLNKLRTEFQEYNQRFFKLIGRKFAW